MTSIKPVLNYRPDKEGRYTLLLQVIHNRKKGVFFTSYRLAQNQFDKKNGRVIEIGKNRIVRQQAREINDYITSQIKELRRVVDNLLMKGITFIPNQIIEIYRHQCDKRYLNTYIESLCRKLEQQGRHGTARNYRSTLISLEKFAGTERSRLEDINAIFIADFEDSLRRDGKRRNTITFYLRVLRAIYNKARRDRLIDSTIESPFNLISFREDKTRKLAVNEDVLLQVVDIEDLPLRFCLARDLFLFSFYARGMSFVDMAYLQQKQIYNGILHYNRRKTGQPFSVRITSPMEEILQRYSNYDPWVFPLMCDDNNEIINPASYTDEKELMQLLHHCYNNSLSRQTRYLERISDILGLESKLSFNVARHSWASLARSRGVPISVISGGLGHASEKTTNIYLDELNNNQLDEANDLVTKLR